MRQLIFQEAEDAMKRRIKSLEAQLNSKNKLLKTLPRPKKQKRRYNTNKAILNPPMQLPPLDTPLPPLESLMEQDIGANDSGANPVEDMEEVLIKQEDPDLEENDEDEQIGIDSLGIIDQSDDCLDSIVKTESIPVFNDADVGKIG